MTIARRVASLVAVALFVTVPAGIVLSPGVASADERSRVESIAAKGSISPMVPLASGLGLGLCAALLALGLERRARSRR
jgi:hypothetical protein